MRRENTREKISDEHSLSENDKKRKIRQYLKDCFKIVVSELYFCNFSDKSL